MDIRRQDELIKQKKTKGNRFIKDDKRKVDCSDKCGASESTKSEERTLPNWFHCKTDEAIQML